MYIWKILKKYFFKQILKWLQKTRCCRFFQSREIIHEATCFKGVPSCIILVITKRKSFFKNTCVTVIGVSHFHKLRVMSSNPRVKSLNPRLRRLKAQVANLKTRVERLQTRVRRLKARTEVILNFTSYKKF